MNKEIRFLIQCFFGDVEDPYLAAIDKAYFDMQTHTVSGETRDIYNMRRHVTECLYGCLKNIGNEDDYNKWHKDTAIEMKKADTLQQLTYGQIQKWINMTVKYLYTLKSLGVAGIDSYFVENKACFHAPIDSYVLNHLKETTSWSKIDSYDSYKLIADKISFEEEYLDWPQYARDVQKKSNGLDRLADKNSYKRYIQDELSDKGIEYCGMIRWKTK